MGRGASSARGRGSRPVAPAAGPAARVAPLLDSAQRLILEGRALLAGPLLDDALQRAPAEPEVHRLSAIRAITLDRGDEAVGHAARAVSLAPRRGDLHLVAGRAHKAAGKLEEALECYRRAVNLAPGLAEAHVSLGIAMKNRGRLSDAIACYRRALEINPRLAAAHANLGNALMLQADQVSGSSERTLDPAVERSLRRAIELDPQSAKAKVNWARALDQCGRSAEAVPELNAALALAPGDEDICSALVALLFKLKWFESARQVLETWLPLNPGRRPRTANALATALLYLDRYSGALELARRLEQEAPTEPEVLYSIACAQLHRLEVPGSVDTLRRLLEVAPDYAVAREMLALTVNYCENDPHRVLSEHRAFGDAITRPAPVAAPPWAAAGPRERLRVGLLSGDLRRHSVAYFLEPLLEAHDRQRLEVVAYHNSRHFDEVSERLKAHVARWVPCADDSDEDLVTRIRRDAIDVLVDLSGTTADGRTRVLAMRAAPLQVVYLGYPTTTGIPAVDVRISDPAIDPPGSEELSSERIVRMPGGMFCYRPDGDDAVGDLPMLREQRVTFGSFNNLAKLSNATIDLWVEVLRSVPGSRLLLKTKALGDDDVRRIVAERFAARGIGPDRLWLNPWRPDLRSHLELYREVDIALDTGPYNGATTTCEALWSGVPVVTLRGRTHTARMGASILGAVGLADWIADDASGYVQRAVAAASDPARLQELRLTLRDRLRQSALMDARARAGDFVAAVFEAWAWRCSNPLPATAEADVAGLMAAAHGLAAAHDHDRALPLYRRAAEAAPDDLNAHWGVARTLAQLMRVDEALEALRELVERDPNAAAAWFLLAGMREFRGEVEAARQAYDRAATVSPSGAIRLCRELLLPSIVPAQADLDALRAAHARALDGLLAQPPALADPLQEVNAGPVNQFFRLAYHGRGNRDLHVRLARVMLAACPSLAWTAPHCRPGAARRREGPIRVGFISRFFRQHSIGKTSVGLIEQFDRRRFEVIALFVPPRRDDPMADRIARGADRAVTLPGDLAACREAIAALELDVLFYQDIGMEPQTYYLAFSRLAPVQCVSFGHPDTTGIPNMDAWISAEAFEPSGAAAHYSERLVLLPRVGTLAHYDRPVLQPDEAIGRAGFGLPEGVPLIACPQGLFKFHPEMDDLLAGIVRRLPGARLLLVRGDVPTYQEQLLARWRARGDGLDESAVFFPPLAHQSFLALFATADVVLDTVHFNGMNSSLEALALGAPVVTWPRELQRGRHTQGMYRRMGYTDLVARDAAHYVELVVQLATDPSFNAEARRRILASCGVLFEDREVVRGFESAFETLVRDARRPATPRATAGAEVLP